MGRVSGREIVPGPQPGRRSSSMQLVGEYGGTKLHPIHTREGVPAASFATRQRWRMLRERLSRGSTLGGGSRAPRRLSRVGNVFTTATNGGRWMGAVGPRRQRVDVRGLAIGVRTPSAKENLAFLRGECPAVRPLLVSKSRDAPVRMVRPEKADTGKARSERHTSGVLRGADFNREVSSEGRVA